VLLREEECEPRAVWNELETKNGEGLVLIIFSIFVESRAFHGGLGRPRRPHGGGGRPATRT
jgi:hypothetical protein